MWSEEDLDISWNLTDILILLEVIDDNIDLGSIIQDSIIETRRK